MREKSYIVPALCLSAVLVIVTAICLLWIGLEAGKTRKPLSSTAPNAPAARMIADIYQKGTLIQSIPLHIDAEQQFTLTNENNGYNTITIKDGAIAITDANCPDKLCVHQGYISTSLLPITCLPNGVVIQVRENDTSAGNAESVDTESLDAITY